MWILIVYVLIVVVGESVVVSPRRAFAVIREERPDALLILADRVFLHNRERLIDFTKEQRLPTVNAYKELVEVGGLMSYGPSHEDMHKRAAIYVDKILKGAKPADLPIEQPSKFTFIVSLKGSQSTRCHSANTTPWARRPANRMSPRVSVIGTKLTIK